MDLVKLLSLILNIAAKLTSYLQEKQLLEAGKAEAVAQSLTQANEQINAATVARQEVRDDLVLHPERLRDDDGFKRPE